MEKVKEVILNIEDLKYLEAYLIEHCGLDTLDIAEILFEIEKRKNINLDI